MITKKFKSSNESKIFKEKYSSGETHTELIVNVLNPSNSDKYPEVKNFTEFFLGDSEISNKILFFKMFCEDMAQEVLKELYGKCDFTFQGNRTYKNYVLEFNDLTFITPSKREVVINQNDLEKHIPTIIEFEKQYQQLVFNHMMKNLIKLPEFIQNDITLFKSHGIISEDNIINYDYFLNHKTLKKKF